METSPHPEGTIGQPVMATVIQPAPIGYQSRRRSIFSRIISAFFVLIFIGSLLLNFLFLSLLGMAWFGSMDDEGRVQERFYSHQYYATDKVAILTIDGVIISGEGFFKRQIDHALKDAKDGHLKALVIRVNSPGGTMSGSDYMYHHLCELAEQTNIPIVVSMGGIAASGGYYASMAVGDTADTIFAEPTTWTGSIGVVIPHYNFAGLMKEIGVAEDSIASNPLKEMGSFSRPMTEEERKIFQALVEDGFTRFKDVVKYGRPKFKQDPSALDKLATGQVFTADQAQQNGLIDKIGFMDDAVDRAIALARLDKDNVKVIKYKPEPSLTNLLLGVQSAKPANLDLAALLDMGTPKAYYLFTWLPPLAGKP
ncbi:MAG: signal peptide peptidase SppA [Thermoguttaceae bacterium]|jgi:protease-4